MRMHRMDIGLFRAGRLYKHLPSADSRAEQSTSTADSPLPWKHSLRALASRLGLDAELDLEDLARQEEARLAQQLFLRSEAKSRRAVIFAGVEAENGCAGLCVRTARTVAALTPRQVCVMDANLRSPSVHRWLGMESGEGLSTALRGSVPASLLARRLSPENLWILPSGSSASADDLSLNPDRVQPHMKDLASRFDHLLISSPPVNSSGESLALGQLVDGLVLIVEANQTRRQAVQRAVNRLEAFDIPLLGIVLSGRTFPIPEPLYRLL